MVDITLVIGAVIAVVVITVVLVVWLQSRLRKKISLEFADDMGTSYVLKTKNVEKAYSAYKDLKEKRKCHGMVISRVFPERLCQKYELEKNTFMWLSYEKTKESIDPSDLEKLEFLIHDFASAHKDAVVLLDGVEYLILQNSFDSTLRFLQSLNDQIILNRAVLVIPLDPASLEKKELSLLERELETLQVDYRLSRFFE
ncbi:MAG: hypothetical protein AYK18_13705 [Theionarchaea archaeon DG-70]|nr:MAG: hypothetical protein AYK18_13705 [Theionarchaea archaeon DG-70]